MVKIYLKKKKWKIIYIFAKDPYKLHTCIWIYIILFTELLMVLNALH